MYQQVPYPLIESETYINEKHSIFIWNAIIQSIGLYDDLSEFKQNMLEDFNQAKRRYSPEEKINWFRQALLRSKSLEDFYTNVSQLRGYDLPYSKCLSIWKNRGAEWKHDEELLPVPGQNWNLELPQGVSLELVYIAPGSFQMGANDGNNNEQAPCDLKRGLLAGKSEVTQAQWQG